MRYAPVVFFVVQFVRALPWPEAWRSRKPLSCHACMTGWTLLALVALKVSGLLEASTVDLVGGAGLCLAALQAMDRLGTPMGPPPS